MGRSNTLKKLATILTATIITLLASVAADRLVGVIKYGKQKQAGIIFPPNSQAVYETADFNFTASINSLGFRDHEFSLAKSASYRIIAIGDSYTYGWGVKIDEAWPKVLEADIKRDGIDVEIANLGSPGASPVKYAEVAERAIPLLKPDLVVVAILQGDDLEQLRPIEPASEQLRTEGKKSGALLTKIAHWLYPNLLHMADDIRRKDKAELITAEWRRQAEQILSRFAPEEKKHYEGLDPAIRDGFENGKLNPPLIQSAIKHPDYWIDTFDPTTPTVQSLIGEMSKQLDRIKKAADEYGSDVIVVSVPMGIYVNNEVFKQREKYGFLLDKNMLVSDSEDREISMASERDGLAFFNVTQQFRKRKDDHFFFSLDTHLNSKGHRFFADQLAPIVERELENMQRNRVNAQR